MKKLTSLFLVTMLIFTFALPLKTNANPQIFEDVPKSHPSYGDVIYLHKKKVFESVGRFGLNDLVTREEMVIMIARAFNLSAAPRQTKFSDIPASHENSGFIQSAVDAGIVNGVTATKFEPNAKLTCGQMAALITRAFELPNGTTTFKDVTPNHYAYESVQQLVAANIAAGYPDGTFKPNEKLTRIHAATFLARAMRYTDK
ncbi:MAG: S-layer homology domain-containing protein [Solibacillus sp.]